MCFEALMESERSSAEIAQSVERIHGKDEVPGSIPGLGSVNLKNQRFVL